MNRVIQKGKPRCKLSYKVLEVQDAYDPLVDISPLESLFPLKDSLGGIQKNVTVVGKWVFDSNIPFALLLTSYNMDYCCNDNHQTKLMNGYKRLFKAIPFLTVKIIFFQK